MRLIPWVIPAVLACGSSERTDPGAGGSGGSAGAGAGNTPPGDAAAGECNPVIAQPTVGVGVHQDLCAPISYDTNPPSGGPHYFRWAAFQNYDFAVPEGFLVHSLEHGTIVYWYNCGAEGCRAEVAAAEAMIDGLPVDPACAGQGAERRVILTPSETLTTRWAASAWGWTLRADCFDAAVFENFYLEHFGGAPEDFCNAGLVITEDTCP